MKNTEKLIFVLTDVMTATQKAAYYDCAAGIFDKWYRYNHRDDGASYLKAWLEAQKIFDLDFVQLIEAN